jgi:hypothetical protein
VMTASMFLSEMYCGSAAAETVAASVQLRRRYTNDSSKFDFINKNTAWSYHQR